MEIHYLDKQERGRSRALYEEVFVEDEKAFVDAYYAVKSPDNQILAAEEDGQIVSMLHRNPYSFRFRGKSVPADYIVAVATKVAYRHQGLMRTLLARALRDMEREKMPLTFLMPADEAIYTPFDFRLMGNDDEEGLAALSQEQLSEDYDLYTEKDALYEKRHIPDQEWETTPMMFRLVHLPAFLERIGAEEPLSLTVEIEDKLIPENNGRFRWDFTEEGSTLSRTEEQAELRVSIADLGSFLMGMLGAEELPGVSEGKDGEELPGKLARIRVVEGIYINETV